MGSLLGFGNHVRISPYSAEYVREIGNVTIKWTFNELNLAPFSRNIFFACPNGILSSPSRIIKGVLLFPLFSDSSDMISMTSCILLTSSLLLGSICCLICFLDSELFFITPFSLAITLKIPFSPTVPFMSPSRICSFSLTLLLIKSMSCFQ